MTTTNKILLGLGVGTIGYAVYYNWAWIQRKLLGNVGYEYSNSFGTTSEILVLDGVQTEVACDGKEVIVGTANVTVEGDYPSSTAITPLMPSYEYCFVTPGDIVNVQVSQVATGTYQFMPILGDLSLLEVDAPALEVLSVNWNFGNGFGESLSPIYAPVSSFPTTGIYPITANFVIGSEMGAAAAVVCKFDLQVIIPI